MRKIFIQQNANYRKPFRKREQITRYGLEGSYLTRRSPIRLDTDAGTNRILMHVQASTPLMM